MGLYWVLPFLNCEMGDIFKHFPYYFLGMWTEKNTRHPPLQHAPPKKVLAGFPWVFLSRTNCCFFTPKWTTFRYIFVLLSGSVGQEERQTAATRSETVCRLKNAGAVQSSRTISE